MLKAQKTRKSVATAAPPAGPEIADLGAEPFTSGRQKAPISTFGNQVLVSFLGLTCMLAAVGLVILSAGTP